MRGKSTTELDTLAKGLGSAEDPYYLKPLADKSIDELAELARVEIRYSALSMVRAGRIFMAIKQRVGHGGFEALFHKYDWRPQYVRFSIKLVEVVARFPQAMHLAGGRITAQLLRLPMPKIEALLEDLPPEAVKKLSPWDLAEIHRKKTDEEARSKPRKNPLSAEEAARIMEDLKKRRADAAWENVFNLWSNAIGAINQLAEAAEKIEMEERHYDEIFKRDMIAPLMRPLDKLIRKWRPIEEVQKRATVVERPSFAAR